jgi:hypothetical protein
MHLISKKIYKVMGGLMANTLVWNQRDRRSIPFTSIYYVEYIYS